MNPLSPNGWIMKLFSIEIREGMGREIVGQASATPNHTWIFGLYEDIHSLNFGSGFDCFTSEAEMVFGTAHVKGTEAVKEFFIPPKFGNY